MKFKQIKPGMLVLVDCPITDENLRKGSGSLRALCSHWGEECRSRIINREKGIPEEVKEASPPDARYDWATVRFSTSPGYCIPDCLRPYSRLVQLTLW